MDSNADKSTENLVLNVSQNYTTDLAENKVQIVIYVYLPPLLIILGLIGNGSTCYFVRTKQLRKHSVSTYVCAYTVSNMLSLIFNSSIDWWIEEPNHFKHFSDPVCRLWQFFIRLVTYSGIWFVVAMVTDRFIVVCYPIKAKHICSVFVSKATTVAIMVGMTVISVHALWAYSVADNWCYLHGIQDDPNIAIWAIVSGFCYSFIPILVIFVVGSITGVGLCYGTPHGARGHLTPEQQTSKDLTYSTIIVSFLYFVFNTPATVINIIDNVAPDSWREIPRIIETMTLVRDISVLLLWINYSSIFFVCLISCNLFREVLKKNIFTLRMSKSESAEITNV